MFGVQVSLLRDPMFGVNYCLTPYNEAAVPRQHAAVVCERGPPPRADTRYHFGVMPLRQTRCVGNLGCDPGHLPSSPMSAELKSPLASWTLTLWVRSTWYLLTTLPIDAYPKHSHNDISQEQLQTSVLTDLARDWRMFGKLHEGIHA